MKLTDFPLAWRWTDKEHTVLPDHALSHISPQDPEQAQSLHRLSLQFLGSDSLSPQQFTIEQLSLGTQEPQPITNWLHEKHQQQETQVFLSWAQDMAVITNWGILTKYWQDFYYPSSDDLVVWPEHLGWAVLFHHAEFIQFGKRL